MVNWITWLLPLTALLLEAQARPDRVVGVVTAVSVEARQISIRTDSGQVYDARAAEDARVLRVEPGDEDLGRAASLALADIAVGDRLLARGRVLESGHAMVASSLVVMSRGSIAGRDERALQDWRTRGAAGVVRAVNTEKREVTLSARGRGGPREGEWVVSVGPRTTFRRYADDSVRFADAKPSSFEAIKTGDQLRVLGQKDEAKGRIPAEAIVFGSFRTLAGEVISVRADAAEVTIRDLGTKKPIAIRISGGSTLRRMPPDFPPGPPPPGAAPPAPGGGPPDLQRMMERWPPMPLAELRRGDAVIVSATMGADPSQVTAVALVAGVDFLLRASAPEVNAVLANWNLDVTGVPER